MRNGHDGTTDADAYADSVAVAKPVTIAKPNTSPIAVAVAIAEPVTKCVAEFGVDLHSGEPRLRAGGQDLELALTWDATQVRTKVISSRAPKVPRIHECAIGSRG